MQPEEMNPAVRAMFLFVGACFAALLTLSAGAAQEGAVDGIVVEKSQRRMVLMSGDTVVRSYEIALGSTPAGDKQREGDGKTPEGRYVIEGRNPSSAFHLSLKISYPDASDRAAAAARNVSPGGDIFIHGAPNWWLLPGQPPGDWTRGCIAVTKAEIEEIWRLVPDGTPIEIRP
jgi:murein L,D-transpeptidase YafK